MREGAKVRCGIRVRGAVQGVGFRPAVHRLATSRGLAGFVRNDDAGVWLEIEGSAESVERFPADLMNGAPPLARIDALDVTPLVPLGEREFRVRESARGAPARTALPPDAATCDACLRELRDPSDRRYRYPFINCTDCGPRYTIVRDLPYDRARTTMDAFALCEACRLEYEDPASRRFHAEPNACPACGPRLALHTPGRPQLPRVEGDAALRAAAAALSDGAIVGIKGIGGFFLACDARAQAAVERLRERKRRPHKPFALMARDLATVERVAILDEASRSLLTSRARPIVLLPSRASRAVAPSVAPGLRELGLMLPYSGLHHVLLQDGPPVLVMTSGNRSEEPIARENAEAVEKLGNTADLLLVHDRAIHARADDSVFRAGARGPTPVRRARGFVPQSIRLPDTAPALIAVGAQLKNTICLVRDREAFLSPHVGDLANLEAHRFFEELVQQLGRLLGVRPEFVVHDLHPDYHSTRWALASGLPRIGVQHHHAHLAACLAENGGDGPALGVAFDGTGCGPAGDLWGGEVLEFDLASFRRLAHLRPLKLAGGEAAIREPWRIACAALLDAGEPLDLLARVPADRLDAVRRMLARDVASPAATGAGRWFDAVSAACALRDEVTYEGQAAVELEAAAGAIDAPALPFAWLTDGSGAAECDLRPAVRAIAADLRAGVPVACIAARFHQTLAQVTAEACVRARERTGLESVALSGGCFQNRRLTERATTLLEEQGFAVLLHRVVPPNDGGVSLGQAAVAAHRLARRKDG